MSELNKLKVVDFTAGRLSSDDINTNIPFRDNLAKTRTIQQANAVIGAYVNRNYVDMQNKADKDEIPTKVSELENDEGYITTGDIPSKTSDLINDSGFITKEVNDLTNYLDKTTVEDEFDSIWGDMQDFNGELGDIRTAIDFKAPKRVGDLVVDSIRSKNLLNVSKGRTGTLSGLTISYDINNKHLILNGTTSAIVDIYEVGNGYNSELENYINNNVGNYVLSNNQNFENYIRTTDGYHSNTASITNENKLVSCFIRIPSGRTFNDTILKIQLETGSIATPYSPYQELNGLSNPISLLDYTGITQGNDYTLSDDITNYRYIIVQLSTGGNDANSSKQYIPVSLITTYDNTKRTAISLFQSTTVYIFGDFYFSASNKIRCNTYTHASWNAQLKVWGIK